MAYPTERDLVAVGLSGVMIAVLHYARNLWEWDVDSWWDAESWFAVAVVTLAVILCPAVAGWLSTRPVNGFFFPVSIFVLSFWVVSLSTDNSFTLIFVFIFTFVYGGPAFGAFLAGFGAHRFLDYIRDREDEKGRT